MMECRAENGEDPEALLVQVVHLHATIIARFREVAESLPTHA